MFVRKFARASMTMMMSEAAAAAAAAAAKKSLNFEMKFEMFLEAVAAHKESLTDGPVEKLIKIYKRTIKEIQSIPEEEGYRKAVEDITRKRLEICLEEQDPEAIERRIGCGKFEELVLDAKFECKIVSSLHEWDPWRKDGNYVCFVIDRYDEVPEAEPPGPIPDELYERLKALAKATREKDERKTLGISEDSCSQESD